MAVDLVATVGLQWPSVNAQGPNRIGPFKDSSGNLWVIGYVSNVLSIVKSTDNGATWSAPIQSSSGSTGNAAPDAIIDSAGNNIYVAYCDGTQNLHVWKFVIGTTTWSEIDSATGRPVAGTGVAATYINQRSDGTFVIAYQGPTHSSMGTNYASAYYVTMTAAGVWGTPVELDAGGTIAYNIKGAVLGASDRTHMFFTDTTNNTLLHRSLSSANALDTVGTVYSMIGTANFAAFHYNATLGKVVAGPSDAASPNQKVYRATSGASPTWTADSTTIANNSTNYASAFLYDTSQSRLYATYKDFITSQAYINSCPLASTTWGTPSSLNPQTISSVDFLSMGPISNGIGCLVYVSGANQFLFIPFNFTGPRPVGGTVSATSIVSGAGYRLAPMTRQITGTLNATATVSGAIKRLAGVRPTTTITATSTVSGAVARLKPVVPTTAVAATSTVGGSVRKTTLVKPTTVIAATSVVSGLVTVRRRVKPTTIILATSTVSGAVAGKRPIVPIVAFPSTPILDNFSQIAGTAPPSSSWSRWLWSLAGDLTAVGDGTVMADEAGGNVWGDYWNVAQYLDSEVYVGLSTAAAQYTYLGVRGSAVDYGTNGTRNPGYVLQYQPPNGATCLLYRNNTQIGSFPGPICNNGGAIGLRAIGTNPVRIEIWAKADSVSPWILYTVYNDYSASRITTPGYVGVALGPTQRADYAGGGVVVPLTNIAATSTIGGAITRVPGIVPDLVFPTTPLLDDFNRAGTASPPSASWSHLYQAPTTVDLGLFGDGDSASTGGLATSDYGGSYWNPSVFGPDSEVYFDMDEANTSDDGTLIITARGKVSTLAGSAYTSYQLLLRMGGYGALGDKSLFELDRYNAGVQSYLGAFFPAQIVSGSSIGFRIRGTNPVILEGFLKLPGDIWRLVASWTDSSAGRILAAGAIGVVIAPPGVGPPMRIDNFSGGTIVLVTNVYAHSTVSGGLVKGGGPRPIAPATIAAISAISGGLVVVRRLPVTTVAATATVAGKVVAIRAVAPASIAATSTVSGSLRAIRRVAPTTVAATSTVGGLVTKAPVKPITGAITATSTVSGSLRVTRRIPAAAISATSVVSGTVQHIARITPTTVAATSTVSGFIVKAALSPKPIVPTLISATSTMSGKVLTTHRVSGAVAATSVVSGTVAAIHKLVVATVSATSLVSGTVSKAPVRPVSATIAATSVVSGRVATKRFIIVANVAAFSTVQGLVKRAAAVRPTTVLATSTVSGAIGVVHKITGTVLATSTVTGSIYKRGIQVLVATVVSATSTVSGRVTAVHRVAGTVLATSTIVGIVRRLRPITPAQVSATSVVSGKVVVIRRIGLATSISATSTVTGNLVAKRIVKPSANVFATSTVQGSIVRKIPLQIGNIYATSTVSGTLISKPQGTRMYWPQSGTISLSKTGRISVNTNGRTEVKEAPAWV